MAKTNYKFSGHESFVFRYAWLPKIYNVLKKDPLTFSNEDQAMIKLGVGKNMVKSMRFWGYLIGIIESSKASRELAITPFAEKLLETHNGFDPYLEDTQTLWLLHWKTSTSPQPLYVWDFLLNKWHEPEIIFNHVLSALSHETKGQHLSKKSLEGMIKIFLHTYIPAQGKKSKVLEDNLDCPLSQLGLIEFHGLRPGTSGKQEEIYAFRRGAKPEIKQELFFYCLSEFWSRNSPEEKTISLEQITSDPQSPGQIFKLSDQDIEQRLLDIKNKHFIFTDTATSRYIERRFSCFEKTSNELLEQVYS